MNCHVIAPESRFLEVNVSLKSSIYGLLTPQIFVAKARAILNTSPSKAAILTAVNFCEKLSFLSGFSNGKSCGNAYKASRSERLQGKDQIDN